MQRIKFLSECLSKESLHSKIIRGPEWFRSDYLLIRYLARVASFFHILILSQKNKVVTEVILSPVFLKNVYLTIHDMKANNVSARRGLVRKYYYKFLLKCAKNIITVSADAKKNIIKFSNINPKKINVIYNGITEDKFVKLSEKKNLIKQFDFIYISAFARHKNHIGLLNWLPKTSKVAFVGKDMGYLSKVKKTVSALDLNENVDFFIDVNDEEMISLIARSKVGVYPSLYEGFGIPLLEYTIAGLPVICSKLDVFVEINSFGFNYCNFFSDSGESDLAKMNLTSNYLTDYSIFPYSTFSLSASVAEGFGYQK